MSTPNQLHATDYERRLVEGSCVYSAICTAPPPPGESMCAAHAEVRRAKQREAMRKLRRRLRKQRQCIDCKRPSRTLRCRICRPSTRSLAAEMAPISGVNLGVNSTDDDRAQRIAAATSQRLEDDGRPGVRTRYHGRGKKGQPTKLESVATDVRGAALELERALAALARYHSPEVQALPPIQRDGARDAVIEHFALADRFLDEARKATERGR